MTMSLIAFDCTCNLIALVHVLNILLWLFLVIVCCYFAILNGKYHVRKKVCVVLRRVTVRTTLKAISHDPAYLPSRWRTCLLLVEKAISHYAACLPSRWRTCLLLVEKAISHYPAYLPSRWRTCLLLVEKAISHDPACLPSRRLKLFAELNISYPARQKA